VLADKLPTDKLSPLNPPDVLKSPSTVIPPTIVKLVPSQARLACPSNSPPALVYTTAPAAISETAAEPNVACPATSTAPVEKSNTTLLAPYMKSPAWSICNLCVPAVKKSRSSPSSPGQFQL